MGVDVPVPQVVEEIVEQVVDVPVPQTVEEVVQVPQVQVQEKIVQRAVEQVVQVPRPQVVEKVIEVPKIQVIAAPAMTMAAPMITEVIGSTMATPLATTY